MSQAACYFLSYPYNLELAGLVVAEAARVSPFGEGRAEEYLLGGTVCAWGSALLQKPVQLVLAKVHHAQCLLPPSGKVSDAFSTNC